MGSPQAWQNFEKLKCGNVTMNSCIDANMTTNSHIDVNLTANNYVNANGTKNSHMNLDKTASSYADTDVTKNCQIYATIDTNSYRKGLDSPIDFLFYFLHHS